MAANTSVVQNPSLLSTDELLDEYEKLSKMYSDLKMYFDRSEQQIYELKRNLQLSDKRETFLQQELDAVNEGHESEMKTLYERHQTEADDLRNRLTDAKELNSQLECEIERMKTEVTARIEAADKKHEIVEEVDEKCRSQDDRQQYIDRIEAENVNLIQNCDELRGRLDMALEQITQNEANLENLREQCACTEDNLNTKRNELEEKTQMIDTMQEKIAEISAELATYKSNTDTNKKGNSLFAEVDDQRQKMKDILAAQKQQYLRMKKEHHLAQIEIRRLKRENADMKAEIEACQKMFLTADRYEKVKLNERIGELNKDNELLKKKLAETEANLSALANDRKITWLDSMLEYCKNETEQLKKELYSCRLNKVQAEDCFVMAKEEASKWRFEALKSRCIIFDREMLLEEHNIPFKPVHNVKALVLERFNGGSKECPDIGVQQIQKMTATTPDNSIVEPEHSDSNFLQLSALEDKPIENWDISLKMSQEFNGYNESATQVFDDSIVPSDSMLMPNVIEKEIKRENLYKENVATKSSMDLTITNESSGISVMEHPQFRDIQMSVERRKILKEVSQEIVNHTPKISNVNISANRHLEFSSASQCSFLSELNALKGKADDTSNDILEQSLNKQDRPKFIAKAEECNTKPTKPKITIKHITLRKKNNA